MSSLIERQVAQDEKFSMSVPRGLAHIILQRRPCQVSEKVESFIWLSFIKLKDATDILSLTLRRQNPCQISSVRPASASTRSSSIISSETSNGLFAFE